MKLTNKNINAYMDNGHPRIEIEFPLHSKIDPGSVKKKIISNQNKLEKFINSIQDDSDGTGYSKEDILSKLNIKNEHRGRNN